MNKKQLSFLLIAPLLALVAVAVEKAPNKVGVIPTANTPSTKTVIKPWNPTAFDQKADRLPPNYRGLDPVKFFQLFESKIKNIKKGEFETSEEFTERTANQAALLSPINTTDSYAFQINDISIEYDADTQTYLVSGHNECKDNDYGEFKNWVTCKVAPISRDNDTYVGSNSYGATRTVRRTYGRDFAVTIAKDSAVLRTAFEQKLYATDKFDRKYYAYMLRDRLPVPVEKARSIKSMKIAALFVGRITHGKIVNGPPTSKKPDIDSPTHVFITADAVPFELKKIIYYVIQTGEILGQKDY